MHVDWSNQATFLCLHFNFFGHLCSLLESEEEIVSFFDGSIDRLFEGNATFEEVDGNVFPEETRLVLIHGFTCSFSNNSAKFRPRLAPYEFEVDAID